MEAFRDEGVCANCPSRFLPKGKFNVVSSNEGIKNGQDYRVDEDGRATCIHPERSGLPIANYIDALETEAILAVVPDNQEALINWMTDCIQAADPSLLGEALEEIEETALEQFQFAPPEVQDALMQAIAKVATS